MHFIQPDVKRLLPIVAVHLKGDVNFLLIPLGLSDEVGIDVISLVGNAQRNVMHLVSDTLFPTRSSDQIRWIHVFDGK